MLNSVEQLKKCSGCNEVKTPDEFYRVKRSLKYKFRARCKQCERTKEEKRRNNKKYKDVITANAICSKCGKVKLANKFYKDYSKRNGLSAYCKHCQKEMVNVRRKNDPIKTRLAERKKQLMSQYGITLEQYDEMFEAQSGVCAICEGIEITGKRLAVDHNHKTDEVRGLLCGACNVRLGVLENKEWREKAEQYLTEYDD